MIFEALTSKTIPYVAAGAAILVLTLSGTIAWLMHSRDGLLEQNAAQQQALGQAALTNRENLTQINFLIASAQWRERQAIRRKEREQEQSEELARTISALNEDLADAQCSGPDYLWPDSVYDRMRRDTVSDPDRDHSADSPSRVPDANTGAGADKPAD